MEHLLIIGESRHTNLAKLLAKELGYECTAMTVHQSDLSSHNGSLFWQEALTTKPTHVIVILQPNLFKGFYGYEWIDFGISQFISNVIDMIRDKSIMRILIVHELEITESNEKALDSIHRAQEETNTLGRDIVSIQNLAEFKIRQTLISWFS